MVEQSDRQIGTSGEQNSREHSLSKIVVRRLLVTFRTQWLTSRAGQKRTRREIAKNSIAISFTDLKEIPRLMNTDTAKAQNCRAPGRQLGQYRFRIPIQ